MNLEVALGSLLALVADGLIREFLEALLAQAAVQARDHHNVGPMLRAPSAFRVVDLDLIVLEVGWEESHFGRRTLDLVLLVLLSKRDSIGLKSIVPHALLD